VNVVAVIVNDPLCWEKANETSVSWYVFWTCLPNGSEPCLRNRNPKAGLHWVAFTEPCCSDRAVSGPGGRYRFFVGTGIQLGGPGPARGHVRLDGAGNYCRLPPLIYAPGLRSQSDRAICSGRPRLDGFTRPALVVGRDPPAPPSAQRHARGSAFAPPPGAPDFGPAARCVALARRLGFPP